jgi:putative DNA methylase
MSTAEHPVISPKKLIEVALPLDAINTECTRRKRKAPSGYPTAFHKWWAQRPVAAARAVLFSQLVNDPEDLWWLQNPGTVPSAQIRGSWTKARRRLFKIIEDLVLWENTTNAAVLSRARDVIRESWRETCELNKGHPHAATLFRPDELPPVLDPFAGGGTIPLEAQRLGLEPFANDLNPVAVVINKAMIEIPPKFNGRPPVHPDALRDKRLFGKQWNGIEGLTEDVRRYGQWLGEEAERRIGHLYPTITITRSNAAARPDLEAYVGKTAKVVAWLWARTVRSPNPAYSDVEVPLVSSFVLARKGEKSAYLVPVLGKRDYRLVVKVGSAPPEARAGTSFGKQKGFRCILSNTPISYEYIREEALAGRMGQRLIAIVAAGERGRLYLSATPEHEHAALDVTSPWRPELSIPAQALGFRVQLYGMRTFGDLFTRRQASALAAFSDLLGEAREKINKDASAAGCPIDTAPLDHGGSGAKAYAEAIVVYLWCVLARVLHYSSVNCQWLPDDSAIARTFPKQALPMVWDFAEGNPFAKCSTEWRQCLGVVSDCMTFFPATGHATASQGDASSLAVASPVFVSTDPPYYDNIGYADLSDFFYTWLRRSLKPVFPQLLATMGVPKAEELVATPYRHGGPAQAEDFFLAGMTRAMSVARVNAHPAAPITIYYAFKQTETETDGTNSTGWEAFLEAVLSAGLAITGTWPMRTEGDNRQVGLGTNSLASSIVLVCRPRAVNAGTVSRRQFVRLLNETLPLALDAMTRADESDHSPVAPVDLSQAIIGPGMAIFSRYDAVLEADGTPMTVKTALQLINRFLAEDDFDGDTQFCLHWFEQHGWDTGKFGEADTLARAKGTSVDGVKAAGVIEAGGGNVRLLKWKEYPADWNASLDTRIPVWEALHQLILAYSSRGDTGAAKVLKAVVGQAEAARQLAYRLYTLCERKGWAEDARAYNEVVTGWSGIEQAAGDGGGNQQRELFDS